MSDHIINKGASNKRRANYSQEGKVQQVKQQKREEQKLVTHLKNFYIDLCKKNLSNGDKRKQEQLLQIWTNFAESMNRVNDNDKLEIPQKGTKYKSCLKVSVWIR